MDKNFFIKIKNFKSFLLDNFNIIDNDIIKRNRKIDFKHIIYTCFNKFINHTSYDINNLTIKATRLYLDPRLNLCLTKLKLWFTLPYKNC